jgi:hypothetical protein
MTTFARAPDQAPIQVFPLIVGWTVVSAVAETIAVGVAAATGAATIQLVVAVALLEGILLGLGQAAVLRRGRPGLEKGWLGATLLAVLVARPLEFAIDAAVLGALTGLAFALRFGFVACAGLITGVMLALPQAYVLSRVIGRDAWLWLVARGAAWTVAFILMLVAGASVGLLGSADPLTVVATLLAVFFVIAVVVGLIEGSLLARLLTLDGAKRETSRRAREIRGDRRPRRADAALFVRRTIW